MVRQLRGRYEVNLSCFLKLNKFLHCSLLESMTAFESTKRWSDSHERLSEIHLCNDKCFTSPAYMFVFHLFLGNIVRHKLGHDSEPRSHGPESTHQLWVFVSDEILSPFCKAMPVNQSFYCAGPWNLIYHSSLDAFLRIVSALNNLCF